MDRRTFLRLSAGAVAALAMPAGLSGCASEGARAAEAVKALLTSYVVPAEEGAEDAPESTWPASDYGDAETMERLETYGVDPDEWHRHCLAHFSFEVGEGTVDEETGEASVAANLTNACLASALEGAGQDYAAYSETQEAEDAYATGGKAALFGQLVSYVYARLDADESPVTTTVQVRCAKGDDGSWAPRVADDEAFFSALYGGTSVAVPTL